MTKITNLPKDLLGEILSRVPLKSTRAVWSTCKTWNNLSNDERFTKKLFGKAIATKEKKILMVTVMDYKIYLTSFNLQRLPEEDDNNVKRFMKREGKRISLNDNSDRIDISQVFHCDGLLLCINIDINSVSRLVVWNPCSGQTRSIKPNRNSYQGWDKYALGYGKKTNNNSFRSYKILKFEDKFNRKHGIYEFEIYSFKSDSWKVVNFTRGWDVLFFSLGVTLKGDTYWYAREMYSDRRGRPENQDIAFLICFDFTSEKLGPRLPTPFHPFQEDVVTLSTVREEQLAVLFQRDRTLRMEIWVTTTIGPREVSWNKFLSVDMRPLPHSPVRLRTPSFFVDEKNKVAVVLSERELNHFRYRNKAYIIGNDGYFKEEDLGSAAGNNPLVCSYVPNLVQIKQPT